MRLPSDVLERLAIRCTSGTLLTIKDRGEIVACLEYDWVRDAEDMLRADAGERPLGGPVLYVSNIRILKDDPTLIWQLRRRLPKARWIVGLTEQWELKAPRGVPDGFYQVPA